MYVAVTIKTPDFEIYQGKSLQGVQVQNGQRTLTAATITECSAQCDAFNCVAFVAVGETDIHVDCYFYSEISYTVNQENATAYIYQNRAGMSTTNSIVQW